MKLDKSYLRVVICLQLNSDVISKKLCANLHPVVMELRDNLKKINSKGLSVIIPNSGEIFFVRFVERLDKHVGFH